ncbi:unnamed protein product, partial [Ixodes hexagonus]
MHPDDNRRQSLPPYINGGGGIANHAFDGSVELPERRLSTDSLPPVYDHVMVRSRPLVQRSNTMVESTRPQRPRFSRQPRAVSLSEDAAIEVYWRRRGSRRFSFCPRGSLLEVIQELGPPEPLPVSQKLHKEPGKDAVSVSVVSVKPDTVKEEEEEEEEPEPAESPLAILTQVFVPFLLAGLGMVAAGVLLNQVKDWRVFLEVPELMVMVPPLLGLKGNLEMTLACRIPVLRVFRQANLGRMETRSAQLSIASGNLALIQCQATVAGLVAALLAIAKSFVSNGSMVPANVLTLAAGAVLTAALASIVLASVMVLVVVVCRRFRLNPDNVATPVAASLGDITTLALLAGLATLLHVVLGNYQWLSGAVLALMIALAPLWALLAHRNPYTREVLSQGWVPILLAVVISSGGGYILEYASEKFTGLAAYQPVING